MTKCTDCGKAIKVEEAYYNDGQCKECWCEEEYEATLDWFSDECEIENCNGKYDYSINGGGTCDKCGHKIPCL